MTNLTVFMRSTAHLVGGIAACLIMASCNTQIDSPASHIPTFIETGNPALLSDWDVVFVQDNALALSEDVLPFDLSSPLFTDYAHKLRTVWMPKGVSANYTPDDALDFPVGTVISKTFYYPRIEGDERGSLAVLRTDDYSRDHKDAGLDLNTVRLIETRILAHRKDGWVALPYVWNEAQTEAVLKRAGAIQKLTLVNSVDNSQQPFPYVVPNANQCAGCHGTDSVTRAIKPIGPKARHLNKSYAYMDGIENQIKKFADVGYLSNVPDMAQVPKTAKWDDTNLSLQSRARAYLDINCAHCHSPIGPADTSGLHFDPKTQFGASLGVCKVSVSAGAGTGGFLYDIDPAHAENSILTFRMDSTDPGIMMPELGRSTIHEEGLALMKDWIASLDGQCSKEN